MGDEEELWKPAAPYASHGSLTRAAVRARADEEHDGECWVIIHDLVSDEAFARRDAAGKSD